MTDSTTAAIKALELIVKYDVKTAPVSPLAILSKMDNVVVVSFEDIQNTSGLDSVAPMFGKCRDAVTSVHTHNGKSIYIVAYNGLLPFNLLQRALARELGHIALGHKERNSENEIQAEYFAKHLLCPRPLIHQIQAVSMRLTEDVLGNLTGIYHQAIVDIRKVPGAKVPVALNRLVRTQYMPFVFNFFEYYQYILPKDGSAIADLGTFMDYYEE